ncbi:MAG: inner membrane CreD family protein [Proteobacteria bacterium]|nr:inner membrane CreD family protein [Pseudomonadota bacterium]
MSEIMGKTSRLLPPLVRKGLIVAGVMLLLLVALAMVDGLVADRMSARQEAISTVQGSVGGPQTTGGVILTVPVVTKRTVEKRVKLFEDDPNDSRFVKERRVEEQTTLLHVLPDSLKTHVALKVKKKRSGLYEVPTYDAIVTLSGEFSSRDLAELRRVEVDREVRLAEATITVLGSEARTLRAVKEFKLAGEALDLQTGAYAGYSGPAVRPAAELLKTGQRIPFRITLELVGSTALMTLPLARATETTIESDWPHPKFLGAQSPGEEHTDGNGFKATWSTLGLSRSFGQFWYGDQVSKELSAQQALAEAAIGVEQYQPADVYQRNYRAVHYAVLVIALTLLAFFIWEHAGRKPLHGMHYLFVGLALAVFYVLLLALSEHLLFGVAYLIAAVALVLLVSIYLAGVAKSRVQGAVVGGGLAGLYATLYLILISEDYALLMGATLLFAVLAAVMLITRRFDWASLGKRPDAA